MKSNNSSGLTILFKGAQLTAGPVQLTQNRIFILPTKYGLLFSGIFLALVFGAVNYNNNLGYLIAFSLGSLSIMSLFHTYRNLSGLKISPGKTKPVFAGQRAIFEIHIYNDQYRERQAISFTTKEWQETIGLSSEEKKPLVIQSPTQSRGVKQCSQITISSVYPLGFFRSLTRVWPELNCLVYPQPYSGNFIFQAFNESEQDNNSNKKTKSGVEEFQDLKTYESGESYKKIDWKAFARGHGLLSKQFVESGNGLLWFDFEDFPGIETETRLSILARLILDAQQEQKSYGLKLLEQKIEPSSGLEHMHNCLRSLALFENLDREPLFVDH